MRHSEGKFRGAGELELYYQSWHLEAPARAAIAIVPGLGEHSGRCRNIGNHLVRRGYAIYAFDLRGNGRSPGQRGYVKEWKEFREDVASFLALIRDREPHTPIFLFGESLGGVIALDYCLSRPQGLSGLICAAPALGEVGVPRFLWMLARVLNRVLPRFSLPTGLDDSNLSRDPEVVKAFQQDSLTHSRGTARLAMEFRRAVEWIHAHADGLELPLLIVHGTADRIASAEGSREFIRKVKFPDKDLREYEGGYHELYNDIIKDKVLADTAQWLERRLCHLHGAEIAIPVSYAQTHD